MDKNKTLYEIITLLCLLLIILCIVAVSIKSCKDTENPVETYTLLPNNIVSVTYGENGNWILYSDNVNFPFKRYGEYIIIRGNDRDIKELYTLFKEYNTHHDGDSIANAFEIIRTNAQFKLKRCSN